MLEGQNDHLDDHDGLDTPLPSPPSSAPSSPTLSPSFPALIPPSVPPLSSTSSSGSGPHSNTPNARKRKVANSKASGKRNRKRKRQEAGPKTAEDLLPRQNPVLRFVPDRKAVSTGFSMLDDAPVASTAYVGLLDERDVGGNRTWSLNELVGPQSKHNFTLVKSVAGYVTFLFTLIIW